MPSLTNNGHMQPEQSFNAGPSSSERSFKSWVRKSGKGETTTGHKPGRHESFDSKESCCGDLGGDASSKKRGHQFGSSEATEVAFEGLSSSADTMDVERGLPVIEKFSLSVQGMTCGGCEKALLNTLRGIIAISNFKTSLMLARAEFDLDVSVMSIEETIARLKQATRYSFKVIEGDAKGQVLEVITEEADAFCNLDKPEGVILVEKVGKRDTNTVRIRYDASIIGARDLVESGFAIPLKLAPPQPSPAVAAGKKQVRKEFFLFLASAIFSIPVLVLAWGRVPGRPDVLNGISLALATVIQLGVVLEFYPSAFKSLFRLKLIEMDLLIVLSTSSAYAFSVVASVYIIIGHPLSIGTFFETSTLLVTLILLGRFMSELARHKATESVSVRSLQSATTLLLDETRTKTTETDARLLQYGDVFRVAPHTRVVTDGVVVFGGSEVDESMVTGESKPVAKGIGSEVIAGSVNGSGFLDVTLTKLPWENTISTIATMVDEAELSKPTTQAIADRIAGYFVPAIILITLIVFVVQTVARLCITKDSASSAAVMALTYAIATLIVSCPCAIGLAVPMVVVIASGVAANYGIIFKSPHIMEALHKTSHIVFDKTGTLTSGILSVVSEEYVGSQPEHITKSLLLGLVSDIKHPVSEAISKRLRDVLTQKTTLDHVMVVPGCGVEGYFNGTLLRAGNSHWLKVTDEPVVQQVLRRDLTAFCMMVNDRLCAVFSLQDCVRQGAGKVVSSLVSRGIKVSIISGDDEGPVQAVARELKISTEDIRFRCSPADKQRYIKDLFVEDTGPNKRKKEGDRVVTFVGDGTNDAVALTQASVGIHMNDGSDIAKSAADVVLVRPDLNCILVAIEISKAAYRRIMFNFAWAAFYNFFAVLLAAGAFVKARVPPEFAGLGEVVSVLPVVLIAFGLKFSKFGSSG